MFQRREVREEASETYKRRSRTAVKCREPGGGSNKAHSHPGVLLKNHWRPYSQATPTALTNLRTRGFFYGMDQQWEGISLPWRAEAGVIFREDVLFKTELPWGPEPEFNLSQPQPERQP